MWNAAQVQWNGVVMRNGTGITVPISTSTRSYDSFKYSIDLPSPTSWRLRIQNAQVTDEGVYICKVQVSNQNYAEASEELVIVGKSLQLLSVQKKKCLIHCFLSLTRHWLIIWWGLLCRQYHKDKKLLLCLEQKQTSDHFFLTVQMYFKDNDIGVLLKNVTVQCCVCVTVKIFLHLFG